MRNVPRYDDPHLIVGIETADDAGVYRLTDDLAVINTVDYFAPIVDDPYTFGAIAVTNALSDVYSMGGQPRTALNIVFWDEDLPAEVLGDIIRGGADKLATAGCALVGGHSVRAPELMYGAAITGTVHPTQLVRNCDAHVGDALVLTKPLGVGVLTTAAKFGDIGESELHPAIESMLQLNSVAAVVMREYGAHAATDVTGYGLIGHGHELAAGSGVAIQLHADRIPVLDLVYDMVDAENSTRASRDNRAFVDDDFLVDDSVRPQLVSVVFDAETSGGLLMAIPTDRADQAVESLHARGCLHAAVVGRVTNGQPGQVALVS